MLFILRCRVVITGYYDQCRGTKINIYQLISVEIVFRNSFQQTFRCIPRVRQDGQRKLMVITV